MGATVGVTRRIASLRRGETNKVNNLDFGWHSDIEGALAELALAKYLNVFWDGSVNTFKKPDAGGFQVRHTQYANGCLIVRAGDDPKQRYCLVTGTHPDYTICGWVQGEEAREDAFLRNPGESYQAWFVPQERLHDPALLLDK